MKAQVFLVPILAAVPVAALALRAPASLAGDVAPDVARGLELYARYCAVCHGAAGAGDGEAAYLLSPAPRDFGSGRFRLVTTDNGMPSDADLVQVLRRGMPGSAMPPWDFLSDVELADLAAAVRELGIRARAGVLLRLAHEEDEDLSVEEARTLAEEAFRAGAVLPTLTVPDGHEARARGEQLYRQNCADCHGLDGRGRGVKEQWNEDGTPTMPRDFTEGYFKGDSDAYAISCRVRAGMPGSPMPAATLERPEDAALLAAHVRSLVRPQTQDRGRLRRVPLRAARVASVPEDPMDPAWEGAAAADLELMPLWWRDIRAEKAQIAVLHDGLRLALRLRWSDAAAEQDVLSMTGFSDGAAIQISTDPAPPLFAMGASGTPVQIMFWKAAWELDRERARSVTDLHPETPPDFYPHLAPDHAALYRTADAVGNLQAAQNRPGAAELARAEGLGTLASAPAGQQDLTARGQFADGRWTVVLQRPLHELVPGASCSLALAIWDGAAGDRNGQKSVTIWHTLELQP